MLEGLKNRFGALCHFPPATNTIALICVVVFVVQLLAGGISFPPGYSLGRLLTYSFGFYWPLFVSGAFWQPVSYGFLHGSFWHLALNLFTLLFFGSAVERILGTRRFALLFLVSSVLGGFFWALFDILEPLFWTKIQLMGYQMSVQAETIGAVWLQEAYLRLSALFLGLAQRWGESQTAGVSHNVCIGASAGVFGLVGAFAGLFPRERLVILLFYVIPLKLQARHVALLLMAISLVSVIVDNGRVAHVAHLFGGLAGFVYACSIRRRLAKG